MFNYRYFLGIFYQMFCSRFFLKVIHQNFNNLQPYRTQENFEIANFKLDVFVDVNSKEAASEWIAAFESYSKTTMLKTKGFKITGSWVLFQELRHCIHSHQVKKTRKKLFNQTFTVIP